MLIGSHKRMIVYKKTQFRCSICGSKEDLTCTCFIPEWTRAINTTDNIIPLCSECLIKRGLNFIELGKLKYLPDIYKHQLMRFYMDIKNYLYKYIRLYGYNRTRGLVDINQCILIIKSYDTYIKDNSDKLNWEEFN